MKEQVITFAEEALENSLLFSIAGTTATEVTHHGGLMFTDEVQPLFENSKVTKPIPVMVEGEYAVLNRVTKQWQKVKITKEDIEEYARNTPRDVAVNYEHRREGTAKGWVRLKDTARLGTIRTDQGEKTALFSSLELFEGSAADVRAGYFRDVSIELKPVSKEIIGCALTSTPVMRDLQFYSNLLEDEAPVEEATPPVEDPAPSETPDSPAEPEASPAVPAEPASEPAAIPQEENMDKDQVLAEALQEYGLRPEDLKALPGLIRNSQLVEARDKVKSLATREDGSVVLAGAGLEAAAQLYVFAQDNAELQFSVEGESKSATQLLEDLFTNINAVQVFGQSEGASADEIDPVVPSPEPVTDEGRTSAIVSRIKSRLPYKAAE